MSASAIWWTGTTESGTHYSCREDGTVLREGGSIGEYAGVTDLTFLGAVSTEEDRDVSVPPVIGRSIAVSVGERSDGRIWTSTKLATLEIVGSRR